MTNQGTDAHLLAGTCSSLREGLSYRVRGTVIVRPETGPGATSPFRSGTAVRKSAAWHTSRRRTSGTWYGRSCRASEIIAVGSYKKGSINLEDLPCRSARDIRTQAPLCTACNKRMTSAGKAKGFKCRKCGAHEKDPEVQETPRHVHCRSVRGSADCPGDLQNRCAEERLNFRYVDSFARGTVSFIILNRQDFVPLIYLFHDANLYRQTARNIRYTRANRSASRSSRSPQR